MSTNTQTQPSSIEYKRKYNRGDSIYTPDGRAYSVMSTYTVDGEVYVSLRKDERLHHVLYPPARRLTNWIDERGWSHVT